MFVTRVENTSDTAKNRATFDTIFQLLEDEYYKYPVIDKKCSDLRAMIVNDYRLQKDSVEFEADNDSRLKVINFSIDKHKLELGNYADTFEDFHVRIKNKVDRAEGDRLWKETARFPTNEDFKDLYNRTIFPMKDHSDQMTIFKSEHRQMKEIIREFDQ